MTFRTNVYRPDAPCRFPVLLSRLPYNQNLRPRPGDIDYFVERGYTVVLFGSEHTLWLAGMMAGALYNLLLYKTHRLWPCILAHGVTNVLLGVHVLVTQEWHWW